jgi:beta-aspartyl-peptidase (threonine type)
VGVFLVEGTRGKCGSCTGVRTVKNPVLVAKAIMTETTHCFLAGSAGDELAASKGIEIVDPEYFITAGSPWEHTTKYFIV